MRESVQKKMLEFDKIFKECGSMSSYMGHFLGYFIESVSYIVLSIFLDPNMWNNMENFDFVMFGLCLFFTQMGVKLHINARLQVREEGSADERITVYDYLKYVPIALKDIFYTRVQYLLRFIVRRLILLYLIQGIWFVVRKHIAWKVTVIPVCYMFFVFLVILLEIKPNNTRKR